MKPLPGIDDIPGAIAPAATRTSDPGSDPVAEQPDHRAGRHTANNRNAGTQLSNERGAKDKGNGAGAGASNDDAIERGRRMLDNLRERMSERGGARQLSGALDHVAKGWDALEAELAALRSVGSSVTAPSSSTATAIAAPDDTMEAEGLSAEQIAFFEHNGYLGPLTLMSPAAMGAFREWLDKEAFLGGASPIYAPAKGEAVLRDWHLVYRQVLALCAHARLTAAIGSLAGPDLQLWRSQFMLKEAGEGIVAWHQDLAFPGPGMRPALNPAQNISAWIAIDAANLENGCVRIVPGTHRAELERRVEPAPEGEGLFGRQYRMRYVVDTSTAVALELQPGQLFLFNEKTLHGSTVNASSGRRLGLAIRVTTPQVRVYEGQQVDGQGYDLEHFRCVQIAGSDRYGHNRVSGRP